MNFTVPVYQTTVENRIRWTTIGLGPATLSETGRSAAKIRQVLIDALKRKIEALEPRELEWFEMSRGLRLVRLRLELTLQGESSANPGRRKKGGLFPLILEPRRAVPKDPLILAYHPDRQPEWFPFDDDRPLEDQAATYFSKVWGHLDDDAVERLATEGHDRLKSIAFSANPKSVLDRLPDRKKDLWDDLSCEPRQKKKRRGELKALRDVGFDLTLAAADGTLHSGIPRSPYREELQSLLQRSRPRPVVLLGPPGVGKTTLLNQWVRDLLSAEDFDAHRNLDKVTHVWSVAGKRIIAGMSYLGDWEKRCVELLEDAAHDTAHIRVVLLVEDLHAFGRLGQARDSDRNLAEFFRGPLSAGEIAIVGESTPEQFRRLEDDAPSFASLFTELLVRPTSLSDTMRMMLAEAREQERIERVRFEPFAFRTILEIGGSLFPASAFPGKAIDLVRELGKRGASRVEAGEEKKRQEITTSSVLELLSERTGLPVDLLQPERALDPDALEEELSLHVAGQPDAVRAAADLILRIRTGLTDPRRPYAVYLFTGPTGTARPSWRSASRSTSTATVRVFFAST